MDTVIEKIKRLPELPVEAFEVAGKLGFSEKMPGITIKPRKFRAPKKPKKQSVTLIPNKSQYSIRKYFVWVTYPRVVCQPPFNEDVNTTSLFEAEEEEGGNKDESQLPDSNLESISKKVRYYKLSKLNGRRLRDPWWCSVKYGPWTAMVREDESCIFNVPTSWQLFIVEMPQVFLSWYGLWNDIPPYPSLQVIMGTLSMFDQSHFCCPGYQYCPPTGSCISLKVKCQDTIPA
jgi:hypothetical protein